MNPNAPACPDMRERLLEADPAELRGEGDSMVALHIAGCAACTAAALRILTSQQQIVAALSELSARAAPVVPPASAESVRSARNPRRRLLLVLPPLAAAALLVVFLLQQRTVAELPRLEPVPEPTAYAIDMPVVNATNGSDVAVMQTSNPNITVVWFLKRERQ
jgi:hypothetical protein